MKLTQNDIESFINRKLGNNRQRLFMPATDCKMTDRSAIRIAAAASAMSNAEGGHILFGISLSRKKAKGFYHIDQSTFEIEWLSTVLSEHISPRITEHDIYRVGNCICISIAPSNKLPHRCSDLNYYTIDPSGVRALEEYEIRQLYSKTSVPEIDMWAVQNTGGIPQLQSGKFTTVNFYPAIFIKNTGHAAESAYKIELAVPTAINNQNFDVLQQYFSHFDSGYTIFAYTNKSPIFPNETAAVFEANLFINSSNYQYFDAGFLRIKCYYSKGFTKKEIRLKDLLLYRHATIEAEDFMTLPEH